MTDFVGGAMRAVGLVRALAGACCAVPLLLVPGARAQRAAAAVLARSAAHAGPLWLKLGQWLATRPDLALPALCARLAVLQSARGPTCHALVHTAASLEALLLQINDGDDDDKDTPEDVAQRDHQCFHFERGYFPIHALDIVHSTDVLPARPVSCAPDPDGKSGCTVEELDVAPLAGGALAQVHTAVLVHHRGGSSLWPFPRREDVVVKVLHPGVGARFERSLARFAGGAAALVRAVPALRWCAIDAAAAQFASALAAHADLRTEHAHLARFRRNFACTPWRGRVDFPRPCTTRDGCALAARTVLVEGRAHGVLLRDALPALAPRDRRALAQLGARAFLKMALADRFVHLDLHPGNVVVRPRAHPRAPVAVTLLDAAAAAPLARPQRDKFVAQARLVLRGRYAEAADLMVALAPPCDSSKGCKGSAATTQETTTARTEFVKEVGEVFREAMAHRDRLVELPVGAMLHRVQTAARRAHVRLDPGFASVIAAAVVADGVARQLDPAVDIVTPAAHALARASLRARIRSIFLRPFGFT